MDLQGKKVAIVHDFLIYYGGAEKVLETLAEMFPEAPIYTLLYDKERMRGEFSDREIRTSFLQKFPKFLRRKTKYLLPFLPTAPEIFDLREFDLVISSSGAWSKGIVTKLNTAHIAYIHSPMRYAWDYNERYINQVPSSRFQVPKFIIRIILNYLRLWDKMAADRPDYLIVNSRYTQERIKKYYRRESQVIYPPANRETQIAKHESQSMHIIQQANLNNQASNLEVDPRSTIHDPRYFLVVSRLSAYKKIDAIINAFNKLGLPLLVVGEGEQKKYLKSIAGNNVKILGWQSEEKIKKYYQNARALVAASVEDFGLSPVEAMSFGVPVVALREGGFLETIIEGKTGEFFDASTPEVIADGVRRFIENENDYNREEIKKRAKEFSKEKFIRKMESFINEVIKNENYRAQENN